MDSQERKEFRAFLKSRNCRVTEERLRLFDGIKRQRGHFNVDLLVSRLKKHGIKIGRDTIYRNIPVLLEAGVLEQSFKTTRDTFFESTQQKPHHDHIMCRNCGKVIEFRDAGIEKLQKGIAKRNGFKLEYHCHQLVGLCSKCRK